MKINFKVILISFFSLYLTGCAGVIVVGAGAATAAYFVTDPRSSSELLHDQDISLQINALGNKAPFKTNVRVTASTFKGNTLLMGQAISQEYKDSLDTEVRKIAGVNVVYNQLKVKPLLSITDVSNDTWITTKVKSALIADSELRDIKISVFTEDSEVFLVGSVSPYHADKAVDVARNISGVKKVVKAFYYGEEDKEEKETSQSSKPAPTESLTPAKSEPTEEVIPYIEPEEVDGL